MTKTKRHDRNDHSKHASSEDVAVTAASPSESVGSVKQTKSPNQTGGNQTGNQTGGQTGPEERSPEASADDCDRAVRELAYSKWEAAGFPEGNGFDFWLEAEREVKACQQTSPPAAE